MQEAVLKYFTWIGFGVVGIVVTFYVFGAELPVYLLLAIVGLVLYAYSNNPFLKFAGGWIGRLFAVLFVISLFYYFGTKTFFPDDQFNFVFLSVGIGLINEGANRIGEFVLNLFR